MAPAGSALVFCFYIFVLVRGLRPELRVRVERDNEKRENEMKILIDPKAFYNSRKPVAAVSHSPGVFDRVICRGKPLVKDKRVTGFTDGEEAAMNLTHGVTFVVEDRGQATDRIARSSKSC